MKQIITNRDLPVRLKNVFIKSFGDVFAIISILILEYELYKKDKEFETPAEIHKFTRICLARQFISDSKNRSDLMRRMKFSES